MKSHGSMGNVSWLRTIIYFFFQTRSLTFRCHSNLGIDDYYFALETVDTIANHIMALYGAKILAYTRHESVLDIHLERETEDATVYIHSSKPGVSQLAGPKYEKR